MTGGVPSGAPTICRGVSSPYAQCTISPLQPHQSSGYSCMQTPFVRACRVPALPARYPLALPHPLRSARVEGFVACHSVGLRPLLQTFVGTTCSMRSRCGAGASHLAGATAAAARGPWSPGCTAGYRGHCCHPLLPLLFACPRDPWASGLLRLPDAPFEPKLPRGLLARLRRRRGVRLGRALGWVLSQILPGRTWLNRCCGLAASRLAAVIYVGSGVGGVGGPCACWVGGCGGVGGVVRVPGRQC